MKNVVVSTACTCGHGRVTSVSKRSTYHFGNSFLLQPFCFYCFFWYLHLPLYVFFLFVDSHLSLDKDNTHSSCLRHNFPATILWVFVFNAYSSPPLLPPSFQFTSLQFTSLSVHIHFSSLHFSSLHFQFTSTSVHFTITWCTEYELQGGVALMSPVRSAQQAMVFQHHKAVQKGGVRPVPRNAFRLASNGVSTP